MLTVTLLTYHQDYLHLQTFWNTSVLMTLTCHGAPLLLHCLLSHHCRCIAAGLVVLWWCPPHCGMVELPPHGRIHTCN